MPPQKTKRVNRGAYTSPFSGVGVEYLPLGVLPDRSGIVLHESGYLKRNSRWRFPNVLSPFWRLYFDLQPGHKVIFPDKEYPLGPGHIVLIPPHVLFHCWGDEPVSSVWFSFNTERRLASTQTVPIVLPPKPAERALLEDFVAWFARDPDAPDRSRVFHASLALLHATLNRVEIRWATAAPEWLARVTRHIEQNFAKPIYNRELARMAGLSVGAFTRAFTLHQNASPAKFSAQVRVREAAHLLSTTNLSFEEVAAMTGFPNAAYFSRVFRRVTGEPPLLFRQAHGKVEA